MQTPDELISYFIQRPGKGVQRRTSKTPTNKN